MKKMHLPINIITYNKYVLILDVETYNDIKYAVPYDISGIIIDNSTGDIIYMFCLLDIDIFTNSSYQNNIYFKDKLPCYYADIRDKKYKDIDFKFLPKRRLAETLNDIIIKYNISVIVGYNISFDYKSINRLYDNINKDIKNLKKNYKYYNIDYKTIDNTIVNKFKGTNCFDLMQCCLLLLINNKLLRLQYYLYTIKHQLFTDSGKFLSFTEDTIYKCFVDARHTEQHQGFKDCLDENKLLDRFVKQEINRDYFNNISFYLNEIVSRGNYTENGVLSIKRALKELKDNDLIDKDYTIETADFIYK